MAWPQTQIAVPASDPKIVLLLQSYAKFGIRRAFAPIVCNYSGPFRIGEPRKHYDAETRLLRQLTEQCLQQIENQFDHITLNPEDWDLRVFKERGWEFSARWTAEHDYGQPVEQSPELRRSLRKAEENGLRVCALAPGETFTRFGEAYVRTFAEQGMAPPFAAAWIDNLVQALLERQWLEGFTVQTGAGEVLGYAAMVREPFGRPAQPQSKVWTLWYACSLPDADRRGGMSLLLHYLLEEGRRRGMDVFDLGGVDHPSLAFFKEHFANRLVQRFQVEWFRKPWVRWLIRLNQFRLKARQ